MAAAIIKWNQIITYNKLHIGINGFNCLQIICVEKHLLFLQIQNRDINIDKLKPNNVLTQQNDITSCSMNDTYVYI